MFKKQGICLSSFCEASVPEIPFLPRGNGGSGLVVLMPKENMMEEELYFYASQLNMFRWRFSFSRMLIGRRIENLELVTYKKLSFEIKEKLNGLMVSKTKVHFSFSLEISSLVSTTSCLISIFFSFSRQSFLKYFSSFFLLKFFQAMSVIYKSVQFS